MAPSNSRSAARYRKEADATEARNKSQSPLLRLPGELRNRIYDYVFNYPYTHDSLPLDQTPPIHVKRRYCTSRGRFVLYQPDPKTTSSQETPGPEVITSRSFNLLFVCRQLHTETALLPYQHSLFRIDFSHIWTFIRQLSPPAKAAIRRIQIAKFEYYERNYEGRMRALGELTGLESVVLEEEKFSRGEQIQRLGRWMERQMGRTVGVRVVLREREEGWGMAWDLFG